VATQQIPPEKLTNKHKITAPLAPCTAYPPPLRPTDVTSPPKEGIDYHTDFNIAFYIKDLLLFINLGKGELFKEGNDTHLQKR